MREAGTRRSASNGTTSSLGSTVLSRRVPRKRRADPTAPPPPPGILLNECNGLSRLSTSALPTFLRYSAPTPPPMLACANWKRRGGAGNRGRPRRGQRATDSLPRGRSRGAESPGTSSSRVRAHAAVESPARMSTTRRHLACDCMPSCHVLERGREGFSRRRSHAFARLLGLCGRDAKVSVRDLE